MNSEQNNQRNTMIDVEHVTKSFPTPYGYFDALKDVSLIIGKGQLLAITGKSGSGKSTLLNIITGIDKPTQGDVSVLGVSIVRLNESELAVWRGKNVGIVFQFFQLIPTLTVAENVMLPMDFCNTFPKRERRNRALTLLEQVGIADQADKLPSTLSGGQQQRASIARALTNDPPIIVADEPTGNLDSQNAEAIFELLANFSESGKTVVVVTHEKEFSKYFRKTITISDGTIIKTNGMSIEMELQNASQI
jgi:putative ABC transport system ATP-binding protein